MHSDAGSSTRTRRPLAIAAIALALALAVAAGPAAAQAEDPTTNESASDDAAADADPGRTGEASDLGFITMPLQAVVEGEPEEVRAEVLLNVSEVVRNGGRHVLIHFGNTTSPEALDVSLAEIDIPATATPVSPSRIDNETGSVKIWFDVAEMSPTDQIRVDPVLEVGGAELGLYRLEGLVLVMDENYVNVESDVGTPLQLFAFTLVGVNQVEAGPGPGEDTNVTDDDTNATDNDTVGNETEEEAQDIPAPGILAGALAVAAAAGLAARRSRTR